MKRLLVILLLVAAACGNSLTAQPKDSPRGKAQEKLKLTDEQKTQMREIRAAVARDLIDVRATVQKKRLDLRQLLAQPVPERARVEALMKDIADVEVRQKMLLFDADQRIMKMLTPEQQKVWAELRLARLDGMRQHLRERMGRPPRGGRGGRGQHGGMMMPGGPGAPDDADALDLPDGPMGMMDPEMMDEPAGPPPCDAPDGPMGPGGLIP
jgi:Spy/CpxP family protein refolding chaperone